MINLSLNEIRIWQARIERAESYQTERHPEWRNAIKLLTGTFFGNPISSSGDLSEVNFLYEYMKIKKGSSYSRNPYIFCKSRSSKWRDFAWTMEIILNYYWREKKVKQKSKKIIDMTTLFGLGWMEIGYFFFQEYNQIIRQFENEFPELKETNTKLPETQGELDEHIKNDDVFLNDVSAWNVLAPEGYHDFRKAPYLIKIQDTNLLDVLNNPKLKPIKKKLRNLSVRQTADKQPPKLKTFKSPPPISNNNLSKEIDLELIPIRLYHIFDKRGRRRFILARNFMEGDLFNTEWNYLIEGFTLYPLIFNEIPATDDKSNTYPLSDVIPMYPQLKNLSLTYSMMNRHRKRVGTLILVKQGSLAGVDITKIQNSSDLTIIELPEINEATLKAFVPPALPNDVYKMYDIELQNLMRISGYNQLLFSQKGIETATESENVRMGALIRQFEVVDTIEDWTVDIARGLAGLIWQFIQDKNRIAKIIGEDKVTKDMWPTLPEDEDEARRIIQEELEFRIEAGSTRPPKDTAVEQKLFIQAIDTIETRMPGYLDKSKAIKELLKKFNMKELDNLVKGFDEQEIQVAQEENKLLMQGIPQLVSPNENHKLHMQVHSQLYQVAGLEPTPEVDEHILKHSEYDEFQSGKHHMETKAGRGARQEGGGKYSDLVGATRQLRGAGQEAGGKGSV